MHGIEFWNLANWGKVLHLLSVCVYCMQDTPFPSFHFTTTLISFCTDMYAWCRNNDDKTEKSPQKTNTEHLKSLSENRGNFLFNISHSRKPLDQIYTTSLLDFILHLCLFKKSSTGTTAPCTPSIFAWYLVLVFRLKPPLISSVSLISTDWVSMEKIA